MAAQPPPLGQGLQPPLPPNPQPPQGAVQQVQAGGNRELNDNDEPSEAIEKAVRAACGNAPNLDLKKLPDFTIKGSFEKKGDVTSLHSFRNNNRSPECYSLVRTWKVSFTDPAGAKQELTFTKTIYTSVQIPKDKDGNANQQAQYMAGVAASMYCDVVESMVRLSAGQNDALTDKIKDHVAKIRKDRFVTMLLYEGNRKIDPNAKNKSMADRLITHVRLNIRPADKEESGRKSDFKGDKDSASPIIELTAKKIIRKADDQGNDAVKGAYRERLKSKKYQLVPDQDASEEVKKLSLIQQKREIQADIIAADEDAIPDLVAGFLLGKNINNKQFKEQVNGEVNTLTTQVRDRLKMLEKSKGLQTLMFRYANGRPVGEAVQAALQQDPGENLFKKLAEAIKDPNLQGQEEQKDLKAILKAATTMFEELQELGNEWIANGKILNSLDDVATVRKNEVMGEIEEFIGKRDQYKKDLDAADEALNQYP